MKRNFTKAILMALLLTTIVVYAQAQDLTGSLLWRISGNGLSQPSYVFGTHHIYPVSFLDEVAGLHPAFDSVEQVVGELDLKDMQALQVELMGMATLPEGVSWHDLLSEEDYAFVDETLRGSFGAGLEAFGTMKPNIVSMSYVQLFYMQHFPKDNPAEAIDLWFQQQAMEREMGIVGLETVQDQMAALNAGSMTDHANALVCMMRDPESALTQAKRLNDMYASADLDGMLAMMSEEHCEKCKMGTEFSYELNHARNKRWLEKLPSILAEKPSFVAVGCLHLAGDIGILAGLQQLGYTVEAVK